MAKNTLTRKKKNTLTRKKQSKPAADAGRTQPAVQAPPRPSFAIVGVGASAGGLEAFTTLLRSLPRDPHLAIVFVQHLAPQHDSALTTLLSGQSQLPVVQVTEGMPVESNRVYVIPPNTQLVIADGHLHVGPRPRDASQYNPIDAFFVSLTQAVGSRAIAVVLSGTASDGARGVRQVKAAGGIAIAQSPESARYDGMPRAAIATGLIDLILPPAEIGPKLARLARQVPELPIEDPSASEASATEEQLHAIFALLRPASGVDFRHYKPPTIKRRLSRRMALHHLTDVDDYIRVLRADPGEVRSLYRDLLIHVTRFFREPESYEGLTREVLPVMLQDRPREQPIRVWVPGCSTGEEVYSLAITLVEFLTKQQLDVRVQIFGTDVSEAAVEHARAGVYPLTIEGDVSADRLRRFFSKTDGGYRVTKMIRDLCVFARQDLTKDPPFSRLDLILCRNVLIYMDLTLQKKLLSVFHYALNPTGFLMLGQAETVGAQATLFSLVDKKFRIHNKRAIASTPTVTFPVDYAALPSARKGLPHDEDVPGTEKKLQTEVNRVINDRFAPPGVVIDPDMQIVQFRGQTGTFLEPAPGEASLNLLKMAKEGLLYGLRSAIHAARRSGASVRRTGLQVRTGKRWVRVDLEIIPLASAGRMHFLVLFDQPAVRGGAAGRAKSHGVAAAVKAPRKGKSQMQLLEQELAASCEYLQSVIQELEAANEELQSANEEILSSNEELQSTNEELDTAKEELQSTNEELNTVNEELHGRNEELSRVNSDLINLLGSVQIAIVIVGLDMRIRRFTPMAEKVLNLIPADVDRSIAHINPNLEGANLEELIGECIDSISPVEREVRDREGRWYALRVRPYRSAENKIDGAVLALFDIDAPKRHEASVRSATELADELLQASPSPMALLDPALRVRAVNAPFLELLRLRGDGIQGRALGELAQTGQGFEDLTVSSDGDSKPIAREVKLQPAHASQPFTFEARSLPAYDGTPGRLILLTEKAPPPRPDRAG
jgi:two-component system CheB/CheR fusion protein